MTFHGIAHRTENGPGARVDGMADHGWESLVERQIDRGVQLSWAKERRKCQIEQVTRDSYTEVWLRSSQVPSQVPSRRSRGQYAGALGHASTDSQRSWRHVCANPGGSLTVPGH